MGSAHRLNPVRFLSLFGFLPFLVVLVYPPWAPTGPTSYIFKGGRSLIWNKPSLFSPGIAIGQWSLELVATLVIAAIIIGIFFYAVPKYVEK